MNVRISYGIIICQLNRRCPYYYYSDGRPTGSLGDDKVCDCNVVCGCCWGDFICFISDKYQPNTTAESVTMAVRMAENLIHLTCLFINSILNLCWSSICSFSFLCRSSIWRSSYIRRAIFAFELRFSYPAIISQSSCIGKSLYFSYCPGRFIGSTFCIYFIDNAEHKLLAQPP